MNTLMAERIRMMIDTEEDIRAAVKLAAMMEDKSPSEVVNDILRKALAEQIKSARQFLPKRKKAD